jgi:hypothetical protein
MENNILLNQLKLFYQDKYILNRLFRILNHNNLFKKSKETKISLRLIDWFVTNYCKKNKIIIQKNNNRNEYLNIYNSYKSNLRAFSKQLFDPFRRKNILYMIYNNTNCDNTNKINITFSLQYNKILYNKVQFNYVKTTIGQINFFKWIIDNNIYEYIVEHKKIIEDDMIFSQKQNNYKKLDKNNLIIKKVKNKNGSTTEISRKKRIELSKSVNKNMYLDNHEITLYFD